MKLVFLHPLSICIRNGRSDLRSFTEQGFIQPRPAYIQSKAFIFFVGEQGFDKFVGYLHNVCGVRCDEIPSITTNVFLMSEKDLFFKIVFYLCDSQLNL